MNPIYIASDIHGSPYYAKLFFEKVDKANPFKVILLGDCYYNGARNTPPKDYSPKDVVILLNAHADKIICTKGNCESEVDQWVSEFPIVDMASLYFFDKEITACHGHHYGFDNLPKHPGDIFLQGHTHVGVLEKKGDLILGNPGSVSLPKDEHHSYMVMDEKGIELRDLLTDEVLKSVTF